MVYLAKGSEYINGYKQNVDQTKSNLQMYSNGIEPEFPYVAPVSNNSNRNQRSIVINESKPL